MLAQLRTVLAQRQFFRRVHSVLGSVINPFAGLFTHQANQLSFVAFFRHNGTILTDETRFVNDFILVVFEVSLWNNEVVYASGIF